jgi:flagellar biosynthesis chaperone FliJ
MNARSSELRQLQRLRDLREAAARRAHEAARQRRDAALDAVRACEAKLEAMRLERERAAAFVAGDGAALMPRLSGVAAAHRAALDDRIERAEYQLIDDEDALAEADAALQAAHAVWLHARSRVEAVGHLQQAARRGAAQAAERRDEFEAEAARRAAPAAGGRA